MSLFQTLEATDENDLDLVISVFRVGIHSERIHSDNEDIRENLTRKFFLSMCHPDSCLYYLLPAPKDNEIVLRLRTSKKYPVPLCKTRRLQMSFLPYSLTH